MNLPRSIYDFFALVLFLSMGLLWNGCGSESSSGEVQGQPADSAASDGDDGDAKTAAPGSADGKKKSSRKPRERTASVRVSKVVRGNLVMPIVAEGTIRARHAAEIRTEIAGRLVKMIAHEGQFVRKGAMIAKLDDREREVTLHETRANYLQSLSLLAIEDESLVIPERPADLQSKIDELDALAKKGVITREERLAREVALDVEAIKQGYFRVDVLSARSGIAEARAKLERAKLELERTEIRAPFSGIVSGLELSNGEQVTANQTICRLVNSTDIEADVGVLESDIGSLVVGRRAFLVVPAISETLQVTVDVISPEFDRDSRTCQVLLRLKNATSKTRPGMFVRAIIAGNTYTDRILVPREAILTRDGRPLLFKVDGDRAKWLYLRLGQENNNLVEIERVLQGGTLEPDDLIVVADHLTLAHDAKVKVKKIIPTQDLWGDSQ